MDSQTGMTRVLEKYLAPFLAVLLAGTMIGLSVESTPAGDPVWIAYTSSQPSSSQSSPEEDAPESLSSQQEEGPGAETPSASGRKPTSSSKAASSRAKSPSASQAEVGQSTQEPSEAPPEPLPSDDSNLPHNTVGNTAGNLLNGGLASGQGNWIYFVNSEDGNTLYKMNREGTEQYKLSSFPVASINVMGETVFAQRTDARSKISSIRIDGNGQKEIQFSSYSLCATRDGLISANSVSSACITKLGNDYRTRSYLFEDYSASEISVHHNRVYFINQGDQNRLYSVDESGGSLRAETEVSVSAYGFDGDDLLYCCGGTLYRSGSPVPLARGVGRLNVSGESIYYTDVDNGSRLYRMEKNGENPQLVADCAVSEVCLSGGWIFYSSAGKVCRIKE